MGCAGLHGQPGCLIDRFNGGIASTGGSGGDARFFGYELVPMHLSGATRRSHDGIVDRSLREPAVSGNLRMSDSSLLGEVVWLYAVPANESLGPTSVAMESRIIWMAVRTTDRLCWPAICPSSPRPFCERSSNGPGAAR